MNWLIHPIDSIKNWSIKKFVLGIVNEAIAKYKGNIDEGRALVQKYGRKVQKLLDFLHSLDFVLKDGKITEDEADTLVEEAETLAKELTA